MSRSAELIKNTALLTISKITTQAVAFLLVPLYTFYLSASDYGQVDLILTYIALFAPILSVQLEFAAFRFAIDSRDDANRLSSILSTIFKIVLPITGVAIALLAIVSLFVTIPYLALVCLNIVLSVVSAVLLQFTRGVGDEKHFSIASILIGVVSTLCSFVFVAVMRLPAFSLMISLVLANLVGIGYLLVIIRRKKRIRLLHGETQQSLRSDMLRYAIPLLPNNIAWWVLNVSDRTIISMFIGAAANGMYAIANKFAFVPSILFGIFSMSWSESASIHITSRDRDAFFSKVSDMCLRLYSFATVVYVLVIDIFYSRIVGAEYANAHGLIPILAIGAFFQAILGNYSAIYIAKKKTKEVANSSLAAAVINIVVNLALVGVIGVYASALSTAIAFACMAVIRHIHVQRYVKVRYRVQSIICSGAVLIAGGVIYYTHVPKIVSIVACVVAMLVGIVCTKDLFAKMPVKKYFNKNLDKMLHHK